MLQEIIPVAEWMPDMPDLATASSVAQNVIPITPESYGPFPSQVNFSTNVMADYCLGAIGAQAPDLSNYIFAGTAVKLYLIKPPTTTWADVTNPSGSYTLSSGDTWQFKTYNDLVIATDFEDVMQSFAMGSSTTFLNLFTAPAWATSTAYSTLGQAVLANGNRYVLTGAGTSASSGTGPSGTGSGITDGTATWNYQSGAPPKARCLCTPKNFLMVGNTSDPVGGLAPGRIWWSVSGDPTSWPAPGSEAAITGMSDFNDFQGDFGQVIGLVDSLANADVAIFFQNAVWRGLFVGPPDVFDFFPVENVKGSPAPNSFISVGTHVLYLGQDGFYDFDGVNSVPIGANKFDNWFWNTVETSRLWQVIGAADIPNKLAMWAFPSTAGSVDGCDIILLYRWDIRRASYISLPTDSDFVRWLMRSLSATGSLLQISSINAFVNSLAFFTGPTLAAQVYTQTKQLTPGRRSYVQSVRPLIDAAAQTGISIAVAGRTNLTDALTFGAPVAPDISGECPQRNDNRYHTVNIEIAAGETWTHIIGGDVTYIPGGFR